MDLLPLRHGWIHQLLSTCSFMCLMLKMHMKLNTMVQSLLYMKEDHTHTGNHIFIYMYCTTFCIVTMVHYYLVYNEPGHIYIQIDSQWGTNKLSNWITKELFTDWVSHYLIWVILGLFYFKIPGLSQTFHPFHDV